MSINSTIMHEWRITFYSGHVLYLKAATRRKAKAKAKHKVKETIESIIKVS